MIFDTYLYYEIYIGSPAVRIWKAITSSRESGIFWGHKNISDWHIGAQWKHQRIDGTDIADVIGEIITIDPAQYLEFSWIDPHDDNSKASIAKITLTGTDHITRVTVVHEKLSDRTETEQTYQGWSAVLSNLKTYLETGSPLQQNPWEIT